MSARFSSETISFVLKLARSGRCTTTWLGSGRVVQGSLSVPCESWRVHVGTIALAMLRLVTKKDVFAKSIYVVAHYDAQRMADFVPESVEFWV